MSAVVKYGIRRRSIFADFCFCNERSVMAAGKDGEHVRGNIWGGHCDGKNENTLNCNGQKDVPKGVQFGGEFPTYRYDTDHEGRSTYVDGD